MLYYYPLIGTETVDSERLLLYISHFCRMRENTNIAGNCKSETVTTVKKEKET